METLEVAALASITDWSGAYIKDTLCVFLS